MSIERGLETALAIMLIAVALLSACAGSEYQKESFVYKEIDGCSLRMDVFRIPGEEPQPAILWLHPGGLITGGRDWIDGEHISRYVQAGYTVVAIDHRLAPETKLAEIIVDLQDAYAWLREQGPLSFNIDPDRIAVVGHSAGGYLALVAGFRFEPRPLALVSFYGYGDVSGAWYSQPIPFYNQREAVSEAAAYADIQSSGIPCNVSDVEMDSRFQFYVRTRQLGTWPIEVTGHDPATEATAFAALEPVQNTDVDYPPTLLLHGRADTDVPFQQAQRMAAALEAAGVENELVSNPSWGHMFDQVFAGEPAVEAALDSVIAFLDTYLKSSSD
jgi:acetyl esterase/lipase